MRRDQRKFFPVSLPIPLFFPSGFSSLIAHVMNSVKPEKFQPSQNYKKPFEGHNKKLSKCSAWWDTMLYKYMLNINEKKLKLK